MQHALTVWLVPVVCTLRLVVENVQDGVENALDGQVLENVKVVSLLNLFLGPFLPVTFHSAYQKKRAVSIIKKNNLIR